MARTGTRFYIYLGIATIFIAAFSLFFIFHSIEKTLAECKTNPNYSPVCNQLDGFTLTVLVVLLIIGGFVITLTATAYILLSAV